MCQLDSRLAMFTAKQNYGVHNQHLKLIKQSQNNILFITIDMHLYWYLCLNVKCESHDINFPLTQCLQETLSFLRQRYSGL